MREVVWCFLCAIYEDASILTPSLKTHLTFIEKSFVVVIIVQDGLAASWRLGQVFFSFFGLLSAGRDVKNQSVYLP